MEAETTVRLAHDFKNIKGLKDASGTMTQPTTIIRDAPQDFSVLSGEDALNMCIMATGGKGCISVTANVAPKLLSEHIETCLNGDYTLAAKQNLHIAKLYALMFIETNPIPAKESLHMMGKLKLEFRQPMYPLKDENRKILKQGLKEYKLI